jgi:hypothetical protein
MKCKHESAVLRQAGGRVREGTRLVGERVARYAPPSVGAGTGGVTGGPPPS